MSREEQQEEAQVIGPGQILKSARLSANLSVRDIALKIHLKSVMIEDIEADKYDNNISLTFIKGYIKLYAKQVSVPESEIMKAFESINTQKKEPAKLQSFSRRVANQANDDKLMLMTYFILAVVLALVVVWWLQQGENDSAAEVVSSVPETTHSQLSADSSVIPLTEVPAMVEHLENEESLAYRDEAIVSDEIVSQDLTSQPAVDISTNTLNDVTELAIPSPPSSIPQQEVLESPQEQLVESVELVFTFSDDCWMNLSDATGENIAYGVKKSGRIMTVSGLPPFTVTLGAPHAVQISYAGEAVDMSVFKPGNTAKFTLPFVE